MKKFEIPADSRPFPINQGEGRVVSGALEVESNCRDDPQSGAFFKKFF